MANIPIATRDRDFLRVFKILEKTPDAINDRDESQVRGDLLYHQSLLEYYTRYLHSLILKYIQ